MARRSSQSPASIALSSVLVSVFVRFVAVVLEDGLRSYEADAKGLRGSESER
jgi:hypothetical protein